MSGKIQSGLFLVFDGIDGSGHSTILERVAELLRMHGRNIVLTREPTKDSRAGRKARALLENGGSYDPMELQLLFIEDRAEHVKKIEEWLKEGKWVLCDRYRYATIAFGTADGANWDRLVRFNENFLAPRYAFIFDVAAEEAMRRIAGRGLPEMRFEKEKMLAKVRENFLKLSGDQHFPELIVIDAAPSVDEVAESVINYIKPLL